MQRILIVEDDKIMREALVAALETLAVQLIPVESVGAARACLTGEPFDLILLDLKLKDGDGFEFLNNVRAIPAYKDIPVIFISGAGGVAEKVTAFSLGAEDYIVKPFNVIELKARVEAKLRKARSVRRKLSLGDLSIDLVAHGVSVSRGAVVQQITLTPIEYKILVHMASHPDQVFSREQLIDAVWGTAVSVSDRTVDFHIHGLRKKLGPAGDYLKAVPGSGYQFATPPPKKSGAA